MSGYLSERAESVTDSKSARYLRPCCLFYQMILSKGSRLIDMIKKIIIPSTLDNFAIIPVMNNYAYIDNQNLYMATKTALKPWKIDMRRFRVYLKEKYHVSKAYLFMGAYNKEYEHRYRLFRDFGYELIFRPHDGDSLGNKKGNVDTDLVFMCMKDVYRDKSLDKVVIVSGDGDYFRMVEYLYNEGKLAKILLPASKNASSLYKKLSNNAYIIIESHNIKNKVMKK